MIESGKRIPASVVEALSHDINDDPNYRLKKWKQLQRENPAVSNFLSVRLLEIFDEESARLALQVFVEAEEIGARLNFADTMAINHNLYPDIQGLSKMSVQEQQETLKITPYSEELAS